MRFSFFCFCTSQTFVFCLFLLPVFVWASQLLSLCAYFLFLLHLFFSHKVWASAGAAFLPGLLRSSAVVLYFLASFYGGNSVFFCYFALVRVSFATTFPLRLRLCPAFFHLIVNFSHPLVSSYFLVSAFFLLIFHCLLTRRAASFEDGFRAHG